MNKLLIIGYIFFNLLLVGVAIWLGMRYPLAPDAVIVPAPTLPDYGYAVGPGWQSTPTPPVEQALAAITPTPEPTYDWLQPGKDVPCDMLGAIVEASMNYRCETLWASELTEPHVVRARRIEPGAQMTRIHQFGRYWWILFEKELIVWLDNGDPRILVASPVNGCWQALPEATR